ncbi:MAG: ATP-dependent DNA helicase RecG [Anaerolineae bacterium]
MKTLAGILMQEHKRQFDNRVVYGGLEGYLQRWQSQAQNEAVDAALIAEVVALLEGYDNKSAKERSQAAAKAHALLKKGATSPEQLEASIIPAPTPTAKKQADATLESPVTAVSGIGDERATRLAKLGVSTVRDFLSLFPRRYIDYRNLKPINQLRLGDEVSLIAKVFSVRTRETGPRRRITEAILTDGTGTIRAVWFRRFGLANRLRPGSDLVVSGKVDQYLGYLQFNSPEFEPLTSEHLHTARLVPMYPLTEGLSQRWLRKVMDTAIKGFSDLIEEPLPPQLRESLAFPERKWAVTNMHFPVDWDVLDRARKRLAFDEFLMLQLGMLQRKRAARQASSAQLLVDDGWMSQFQDGLPFQLTGAQQRALAEIRADLAQPHPMTRLLQGDVGSGKTVVALAAMLIAVANGKQAALMAPTEILAEQHYRSISRLLEKASGRPFAGAKAVLLVGSLAESEKAARQEAIASGAANLIIGTHALIQEKVSFNGLGLVIVDEQHRFGVQQRAQLTEKGKHPHLLAMSATPIPRTLALTAYGDLDLSVLDEMPPGRQQIATKWVTEVERERLYRFMRTEIEKGRQAFVICPVIEGSEDGDMRAATEEYERLQNAIFPDLRIGLLHGRLAAAEKDAVMQAFAKGDLDILVSTSVVEVGIDVPNATFMLIEEAHRFGLAQIHQFRGRVGRGSHQSYCALLYGDASTSDLKAKREKAQEWVSSGKRLIDIDFELAEKRLLAVEQEKDGFRLAEIDLELRGPGEFFGTRQSGMPDLKVARLSDLRTLEQARKAAEHILDIDPHLEQPEHNLLLQALQRFWQEGIATA